MPVRHSERILSGTCTVLLCGGILFQLLTSLSADELKGQGEESDQQGCSFERQGCTYNIYLSRSNTNDNQALQNSDSKKCGEASKRIVLDDQAQNDYSTKLNNMERSFSFLKDTHESRLKELEGTIQKLVATSVSEGSQDKNSRKGSKSRSSPNMNQFRFGNEELMKRLEDEFEQLRQDLRDKSAELMDTREKLNDTSKRMHEEQIQRFQTSQKLLNAENQITMLKRERAVLKNQLKDRSYKLSITNDKAKECEKKSTEQQDEVMELFRSEATLKEELLTSEMKLNRTRKELTVLQEKHSDLKSRQDRIRRIMKLREKELIDCYSAKTSTFCGFEDPLMCGFTNINDTSDFFDWQRAQGKTPSSRTGPSKDHTCNGPTGHFMFIEASAKGRGSNAILYSPLYRGLTQQCVEFYYHMYGRHIGTLNVYAKARGDVLQSAWRAYGNQGDHWTNARLAIPEALARAGYQIAFEGITQNGYQGDISIDDVSVTDGPCPVEDRVVAVPVAVNTTALDLGQRTDKISRKLRRRQKKRRNRQRNK